MPLWKPVFTTEKAEKGKGLSIAFLDTGISPVADFVLPENRIIAFRDLVSGKKEPYDDNGHGTHLPVRNCEKSIRISSERSLPVLFFRSFLRLPHSQ